MVRPHPQHGITQRHLSRHSGPCLHQPDPETLEQNCKPEALNPGTGCEAASEVPDEGTSVVGDVLGVALSFSRRPSTKVI